MWLDDTSILTTFNTPAGCVCPLEFQKRIIETFGDIKGTAVITDDLLVYGGDNMKTAISDYDKNLRPEGCP